MTLSQKIKLILRKYPETKYNRADFMWKYMEEFHGVKIYCLEKQFKEFWKEEAGLERQLREILKEEEFRPEPETDAKRYEKMSSFQRFKSDLNKEEKDQFERVFGKDDEEQIEKMGKSGVFG